jgi:flavin-dependent dehydrogenase
VETVEHLIVGAGPAGLRAAQVLAEAGREVLVLEKREEIGPKTCAGGLTLKAVRELDQLGLPEELGLRSVGYVAFSGGTPVALDAELTAVRTVPRRELGRCQLQWAKAAGAVVRAGTPATGLDLKDHTILASGRRVRWRHLIGADGSDSAVRRRLGLPSPRAYFAAEYNVPGPRQEQLRVECDPAWLANGYFWVFPHRSYTSVGAVAPKRLVAPPLLRRYLDRRMAALGLDGGGIAFEGATLEVEFRGFHFPDGVHLVGDAAGTPSPLTAEGIHAALVTGEEVSRQILEPAAPMPKTARWLEAKRRHARLAAFLAWRPGRAVTLEALARLASWPPARRSLANWFLTG